MRTRLRLERAGWRTLLEYTENHVRDEYGRLVAVEPRWTAEAEHCARPAGVSVTAATPEAAWAALAAHVGGRTLRQHFAQTLS